MDKVLRFRVSEDERLLLQRAAGLAERKFSDWARLRLLNCARQELGFENSQEETDRAVERLIRPKADRDANRGAGGSPALSDGETAKQKMARIDTRVAEERGGGVVRRQAVPKAKWKK